MTTIDEVTMELFEGIKTAQREGNLLGYVNGLAKRLVRDPVREDVVRSPPRDPAIFQGRADAVRIPPSPSGRTQLGDRAIYRPMPASVREQAMDIVRVANL